MIVKFSKHGKGKASGVLNYLLKEKGAEGRLIPRKHAKVLYGDPVLTEHLIDTTVHKSKYKSGYLSFSERADEISEDDKKRIMQEFEKVIFCGLEPDQYDILWVEHSDKDIDGDNPVGRLELNFVIPCQELRSGKSFQPYYEPADQRRVNAWKNMINAEVKTIHGELLSDPNDPGRKRLTNPYSNTTPRPTPFYLKAYSKEDKDKDEEVIASPPDRKQLEEALKRRLTADWQSGIVMNRSMLLDRLRFFGLNVSRDNSEKSISVTHDKLLDKNGRKLPIRLKGGMFQKDFSGVQYRKPVTDLASYKYTAPFTVKRRLANNKRTLQEGIKIKTEYHQVRYADSIIPKSGPLTKLKDITTQVQPTIPLGHSRGPGF